MFISKVIKTPKWAFSVITNLRMEIFEALSWRLRLVSVSATLTRSGRLTVLLRLAGAALYR